jgi:hypothetical protein
MNEIIGFAAVIVSIFAGILFQNGRLDRVESRLAERIDKNHSELSARLDRMQAGLIVFYRDLGRHYAKIEALEKKAS